VAFSVGELIGYLRIDGAAQADKQILKVQESLDLTAGAAQKTGASVEGTEAALKGAGRAAGTLAASSGKLRAAQLSQVAAQERYNDLLAKGDASTRQLASSEASLIRANERVAASQPKLRPLGTDSAAAADGVGKLREGLIGTVETLAKLGIAVGAFELLRKGIEIGKAGPELTTALNGVQAAAHASDEEMTKARAAAIGLGKDLTVPKATAVDAAEAIQDLVKAGVSLDRAMVAAKPAMLLAAAAQVDLADAARVTGDVMDDFQLKADKATHVANVMAAGANAAGGGLMDLFTALKYVGPVARTLGIDVDTTTAALTELAKSGIQGSMAGTSLRAMLVGLTGTTKMNKAAMADLGLAVWDTQGKFKGLPVLFDQLHAAQERLDPKTFANLVYKAFGQRALPAVAQFAHEGGAGFDEFYKKMEAGDVQAFADKMNRGLSAGGAQLKKEITSWAIDLYTKLGPAVSDAVWWLGTNLPHAISEAQHTFGPLGHEATAVLVPAFKGVVVVLGAVGFAVMRH